MKNGIKTKTDSREIDGYFYAFIYPERTVICISHDGGIPSLVLGMTLNCLNIRGVARKTRTRT